MAVRSIFERLAALAGLVGALAPQVAAAQDTQTLFASADEARAYLAREPGGPMAEAAFRALVDADIAARNPGFPLEAVRRGYALRIFPNSGLSTAEIEASLARALPTAPAVSVRPVATSQPPAPVAAAPVGPPSPSIVY